MKVKDALFEEYREGELSNRLYALDELNRRELRAAERKVRIYLSAVAGLGIFCIVLALIPGRT